MHREVKKLETPSEGYFLAKRELNEALKMRIENLQLLAIQAHKEGNLQVKESFVKLVTEFEKFRGHIRNVMLWDTRRGE
jgi:hypothetical protein